VASGVDCHRLGALKARFYKSFVPKLLGYEKLIYEANGLFTHVVAGLNHEQFESCCTEKK
jgi:hypothetical protein